MLGVKGEWDEAPTEDEIRRISGKQIRNNGQGVRLELLLATMQLGCYEDTRGNYWFGALEPERVHEHDRWHYLVPKMALDMGHSWTSMRYRPLHGCGVQYDSSKTGFVTELEGTAYWVNELQTAHNPIKPEAEIDLAYRAMTVHRNTARNKRGQFNPDQASKIVRAHVACDRLHELTFHFDEWAATNEVGDMPQDMVLRMHGLGAVVDARQHGEEWLRKP